MKKGIITLICVALFVIGSLIIILHNRPKQHVYDFNLAEYQFEVEAFSVDKYVEIVNNHNDAINKAKALWMELLDLESLESYNSIKGREVLVYYDASNDCWLVAGTLLSHFDGSVPHALITGDGKVLAVWMG